MENHEIDHVINDYNKRIRILKEALHDIEIIASTASNDWLDEIHKIAHEAQDN